MTTSFVVLALLVGCKAAGSLAPAPTTATSAPASTTEALSWPTVRIAVADIRFPSDPVTKTTNIDRFEHKVKPIPVKRTYTDDEAHKVSTFQGANL